MQKRDYADPNKSIKSIDLFLTWRVVMAAKEVVSALHVLTSDAPLSCEAWPDSSAFEVLITDYFAGSDDDDEESKTSDSDHNGISTCFNTLNYTGLNRRQAD